MIHLPFGAAEPGRCFLDLFFCFREVTFQAGRLMANPTKKKRGQMGSRFLYTWMSEWKLVNLNGSSMGYNPNNLLVNGGISWGVLTHLL